MEPTITRTSYQNLYAADTWDVWPLDDATGHMLVLFLNGFSSVVSTKGGWGPPPVRPASGRSSPRRRTWSKPAPPAARPGGPPQRPHLTHLHGCLSSSRKPRPASVRAKRDTEPLT